MFAHMIMEDITIMNRTHSCGELNQSHLNQKVTLIGWVSKRRNLGSLVFIDLRDREGITQVIVDENLVNTVKELRSEFLIEVSGLVSLRKDANTKLKTGEIEVIAEKIVLIN